MYALNNSSHSFSWGGNALSGAQGCCNGAILCCCCCWLHCFSYVHCCVSVVGACGCHFQLWLGENSDMGEIYILNLIANDVFDSAFPAVVDIVLYTW